MDFSNKLKKLREEKGISLEDLASKLKVKKETIIKWEKGQTKPGQEKLKQLQDVFGEEITKEDVKNNQLELFIIYLNSLVDKSTTFFTKANSSSILRLILVMLLVFIVTKISKVPFNMLEDAFNNLLNNFGTMAYLLTQIFSFVINIAYIFLSVFAFIYVYDKQITEELKNIKATKKIEKNDKDLSFNYKSSNQTLLEIVTIILKVIVGLILIYVICNTIFIIVIFSLLVILAIKGVAIYGLLIGSFSAIVFAITLIEVMFNFLLDHKSNVKRIIFNFISCLVLTGVSIALTVTYFSSLSFYDSLPSDFIKKINHERITMSDNLILNNYSSNINYVEDDTMGDYVQIDVDYYSNGYDKNIENDNGYNITSYYAKDYLDINDIINIIINNLKVKKVYNYSKLTSTTITITATSSNIRQLKQNSMNYYEEGFNYLNDDETNYNQA